MYRQSNCYSDFYLVKSVSQLLVLCLTLEIMLRNIFCQRFIFKSHTKKRNHLPVHLLCQSTKTSFRHHGDDIPTKYVSYLLLCKAQYDKILIKIYECIFVSKEINICFLYFVIQISKSEALKWQMFFSSNVPSSETKKKSARFDL